MIGALHKGGLLCALGASALGVALGTTDVSDKPSASRMPVLIHYADAPAISFSPSPWDSYRGLSALHREKAHAVFDAFLQRAEERQLTPSPTKETQSIFSSPSILPQTPPLIMRTNALLGPYALVVCNQIVAPLHRDVDPENVYGVKNVFDAGEPTTLWAGFTKPTTQVKYQLSHNGRVRSMDMTIHESGLVNTYTNLPPGEYTARWTHRDQPLGRLDFVVKSPQP